MSLAESISLAVANLRTNKMRSALTLLGIIIGIAAVITILTLGNSLKAQTADSFTAFGVNDITLQVESRPQIPEPGTDPADMEAAELSNEWSETGMDNSLITPAMMDDLRDEFPDTIDGVATSWQGFSESTARRGYSSGQVQLKLGNEDFMLLDNASVVAGREITRADVEGARAVAVIPQQLVDQLFAGDTQAALGQEFELTVGQRVVNLAVIGVYQDDTSADDGDDGGGPFDMMGGWGLPPDIYLPITLQQDVTEPTEYAAMSGSGGAKSYDDGAQQVNIRVADGADSEQVAAQVQAWADAVYAGNPDYHAQVLDMREELEGFNEVMDAISMAIAAIAAISLVVGGIGVMNVMLITVTERTREIGVRKALGARRRDIKAQFLVEAMIVCLIGGLIGVALGAVFGMIGASILGTLVLPPLSGVVVSLLFAVAVGLFFGIYPAGKAARLDPIEALRYE